MCLIFLFLFFSLPTVIFSMENDSSAQESKAENDWEEPKLKHSNWDHLWQALKFSMGIYKKEDIPHKRLDELDIETRQQMLNLIIKDTGKAVSIMYDHYFDFKKIYSTVSFPDFARGKKKIDSILKRTECEKPLCLLSECCMAGDVEACGLSRFHAPKLRNSFDEYVGNELKKLDNSEEDLHLVEFGSAEGPSMLILFSKILDSTPPIRSKKITFHFIDEIYEMWARVNKPRGTYEVSSSENLIYESTEPSSVLQKAYMQELIGKQHANWYKKLFPDFTCKICLYDSTDTFLRQQKKSSIQPRIIIACDINDELCKTKNTLEDYKKLCSANPNAQNYLLWNELSTIEIRSFDPSENLETMKPTILKTIKS